MPETTGEINWGASATDRYRTHEVSNGAVLEFSKIKSIVQVFGTPAITTYRVRREKGEYEETFTFNRTTLSGFYVRPWHEVDSMLRVVSPEAIVFTAEDGSVTREFRLIVLQ